MHDAGHSEDGEREVRILTSWMVGHFGARLAIRPPRRRKASQAALSALTMPSINLLWPSHTKTEDLIAFVSMSGLAACGGGKSDYF
jgi:hypothetical protein